MPLTRADPGPGLPALRGDPISRMRNPRRTESVTHSRLGTSRGRGADPEPRSGWLAGPAYSNPGSWDAAPRGCHSQATGREVTLDSESSTSSAGRAHAAGVQVGPPGAAERTPGGGAPTSLHTCPTSLPCCSSAALTPGPPASVPRTFCPGLPLLTRPHLSAGGTRIPALIPQATSGPCCRVLQPLPHGATISVCAQAATACPPPPKVA